MPLDTELSIPPGERHGTSSDPVTASNRTNKAPRWPYAAAILTGVGSAYCAKTFPISGNLKDFFLASASVSGLLAGFMLTSAAILASLGDRPFLRFVKRQGVFRRLVKALFTAMRWCVAAAFTSAPAVLLLPERKPEWFAYAIGIYVAVLAASVLLSLRALSVFAYMLGLISDEN